MTTLDKTTWTCAGASDYIHLSTLGDTFICVGVCRLHPVYRVDERGGKVGTRGGEEGARTLGRNERFDDFTHAD